MVLLSEVSVSEDSWWDYMDRPRHLENDFVSYFEVELEWGEMSQGDYRDNNDLN